MSWNLWLNEKKIRKIEAQLGITTNLTQIDAWQELNGFAHKVFLQELRKKTSGEHSYTLPEHLQFAKAIFHRLLEIYKKLYKRVLDEKQDCDTHPQIKINGCGYVLRNEVQHIILGCSILRLPLSRDFKGFLMSLMSDYAVRQAKWRLKNIIKQELREKRLAI